MENKVRLSQNSLLSIVFLNGFVLMTFEIVGSRVLAPFMGSSTYVWASIIGVILFAMSAGYWYGGKEADKSLSLKKLSSFLFVAGISMLMMNLVKNSLLGVFNQMGGGLPFKSTISALVLFGVPSFFMATVSPFVVRIALENSKSSGEIVGKFYAISTLGSILGTFAGAILFIPLLGTNNILWILAIVLLMLSIFCYRFKGKEKATLGIFLLIGNIAYSFKEKGYLDTETAYNRVWVYDTEFDGTKRRYMMLDGHVNSGMYVEESKKELLIEYTKYFRLVEHFVPDFNSVLMLGGGAYSFPKYYQTHYPNKQIDVVEIDEGLTKIAQERFDFDPLKNTRIFHEDARTFLSNSKNDYDAILFDLFSSALNVPFQLTTNESYELIKNRMKKEGVLIINVLGSNVVGRGHFLHSQIKTIRNHFSQVAVLGVQEESINGKKNYIVIASNQDTPFHFSNSDLELNRMLQNLEDTYDEIDGVVMTDDYAPANWMLMK